MTLFFFSQSEPHLDKGNDDKDWQNSNCIGHSSGATLFSYEPKEEFSLTQHKNNYVSLLDTLTECFIMRIEFPQV